MSFKNILPLIVLACGILQAQCADRIVGGQVTDIAHHPYIVQLLIGDNLCGGSLIKSNVVLTAAHCTAGRSASDFVVIGGSSGLGGRGGVQARVRTVYTSPQYNPANYDNDVAVLILDRPLSGRSIQTIELCTSSPQPGTFTTAVGWGKTGEYASVSSQLREVTVQVLDFQRCNSMYRNILTNSMLCAASSGKDACNGDSGGPLVQNNQLCGIVSWGYGCARSQSPGVYTDVTKVRSFIDSCLRQA